MHGRSNNSKAISSTSTIARISKIIDKGSLVSHCCFSYPAGIGMLLMSKKRFVPDRLLVFF